MARIRTLIALGLVLALAGSSYAAKGSGKRGKHAVRGTVSTVSTDSVVVKVKQSKKKGGETTDRTFQLTADTKYELVTLEKHAKGEKAEKTTAPAALSDVKPGERVRISTGEGDAVQTVSILKHAGGGKKSSS